VSGATDIAELNDRNQTGAIMSDKELPKGLMEFGSTLVNPEFSGELMKRLLDLPENSFAPIVAKHAEALQEVLSAEVALRNARRKAAKIAQDAFRSALENWTVAEIQKATGYDDE
jgi:hypothetical protein